MKNGTQLIAGLLTWIRSISEGAPVTWAIEDGHGFARRLADGLLLAGQEVVRVPTGLRMAHRKLHAATGAKSDPVDAAATAHAAIATPGLDRHRIASPYVELRVLVDHRAELMKRRTTVINQLKAQLHLWLDDTPGDLARAKTMTAVGALLAAASLRPYVRQTLTDMLSEITGLNKRVRDLDATIKELVDPLAPTLLQITGISHNSATVLIAEVGDITRFGPGDPARLGTQPGGDLLGGPHARLAEVSDQRLIHPVAQGSDKDPGERLSSMVPDGRREANLLTEGVTGVHRVTAFSDELQAAEGPVSGDGFETYRRVRDR